MKEFQLAKFMRAGNDLLEDVRREFKNFNLDDSGLPKTFDDNEKIKLVFIGQYGAGKSSIIKMLTGENISVGADITTQVAQNFSWNGLEIIDTPGIHTELRPDHDKITYDEINRATLLIFVITNEGFSQRMGEHFRNLATDKKRAANMVLVVNKMDRTALGNVIEQQNIIAKDLAKVTAPISPQDLYLSFLDTTAYFDSLDETDSEIKSELLELSGHDKFVDNLNKFVESHELLAKISKPLYTTAEILRDTIKNISGDDDEVKNFLQTVEHKRNLLIGGKKNILRDVWDIAIVCKNKIIRQGRIAAESIQPANTEDKINDAIKNSQLEAEKIVNDCGRKIEDCLKTSLENIGAEINIYNDTDFVKQVNLQIGKKIKFESENFDGKAASGALLGLAAVISKFANPAAVAVGNPTTFAIFAGQGVKFGAGFFLKNALGPLAGVPANLLGNFVQKILSPPPSFWQEMFAMFARNAGNIAKGVAGVAAIIPAILEIRDAREAQKLENKLQFEREKILQNFEDFADKIFDNMNDNIKNWTAENIDSVIAECNNAVKTFHDEKNNSKIIADKLNNLLKRTENFIGEVQNA